MTGMRYALWFLLTLRLYHVLFPTRRRLARKYLSGNGIEIGALHLPLPVPDQARVRYVDRAPLEQLRKCYPELDIFRLTPVDIIDNGEALDNVAPASQDFVIANHFIEHCENPIKTVITHLSRLKAGGVLFLAVPDRNKTFDRQRPTTPLDHVIRDFRESPAWSRFEHYLEWATMVEQVSAPKAEERARELIRDKYSIHFHVWRQAEFRDMLTYIATEQHQSFIIRETASSRNEFIFIIQKLGEPLGA
jgi:SAM-dependent methyltransferase